MYLKKLSIIGFKSFMDKTTLDFMPGITAVVGPNGSGKSNIADAVRWALGEQSAQRLRGGKMEDIIFSGTDNRRAMQYAEVSLVIDNRDRLMPTEYEEICVARRVYRSGESEFLINGTACRLKDIHELFMDTGVGREGYSVVAQGKIDEILSAKSQDRRFLFEEAAGIVKYKSRKAEAISRLEKERQNLIRVNDIISELEERMAPLSEQSETAKQFLSMSERLKVAQINIFLFEAAGFEEKLQSLNEAIDNIKHSMKEAEAAKDAAEAAYEALKKERAEDEKRAKERAEELARITLETEKKENGIKLCGEKTAHLKKDAARLLAETDKTLTDIQAKESVLDGYKAHVESLTEKLAALEAKLAGSRTDFDSLSAELKESEERLDNYNKLIYDCMMRISESRAVSEKLTAQYELLETRKEELLAKLADFEDEYAGNEERLKALLATIDGVNEEKALLSRQFEFFANETAKLKERKNEIATEQAELNKQYNRARSRLNLLTELEDSFDGYFKSVKAVLKHKKENPDAFKGVRGIVAELISTDDAYVIAIETALGNHAQNIVTDDEDDAKEIIEFLKKNNAGRATFLPVSIIKPNDFGKDLREVENMRGFVGVAKSLVNYDPRYENVVSSVLGKIIVADGFDNAGAIARKLDYGCRIVTTEGELFAPGGAITGGAPEKSGSTLFGRAREITALTRQTQTLRSQRNKAEADLEAVMEKQREAREKQEELTAAVRDRELAVAALSEQAAQLRNNQAAFDKQKDEMKREDADTTAQIIATNKQIREADAQTARLTEELSQTRAKFAEYQDSLAKSREEKDKKVKQLTDLKIEIASYTEKLSGTRDNIDRVQSEIISAHAHKDKLERESAANVVKQKESAENIEKLTAELHELRAKLAEKQKEAEQNEKAANMVVSCEENPETIIRDKQEELLHLANELTRQTLRKEQAEQEIKRLFDLMWDEYELTYTTAKEYERPDKNAREYAAEERALKAAIRDLGAVNVGAVEEYKRTKERLDFLAAQRDDITEAEESLKKLIKELTQLMESRFKQQLSLINENFKNVFAEMFGGGSAEVSLTDETNILESGIEITAKPPGKKLQAMSLLSGGERSLTAMSLLFAILRMKPSPFCILDEIDAALDDANVTRFIRYLKKYADSTQFILITHKKGTMTEANSLYGITMREKGVSTLVSVQLDESIGA